MRARVSLLLLLIACAPAPPVWAQSELEQVLAAADKAAGDGELDDAIRGYRRALELQPERLDTHQALAMVLLLEDRVVEGDAAIVAALARFADDPLLLMLRGSSLFSLERWPEAVEALEKALAAEPDDATTRSLLGQALDKVGRRGEALVLLREVVRLPDLAEDLAAEARIALANALRDERRLAEAAEALLPLAEADEPDAEAVALLAAVLADGEAYEQAGSWARKALELDPGHPDAAVTAAQVAVHQTPGPEALAAHADALLAAGRLAEGEEEWRNALLTDEPAAPAETLLAWAGSLAERGLHELAGLAAQQAVARGDSPAAHAALARALLEQGLLDEAAAETARAGADGAALAADIERVRAEWAATADSEAVAAAREALAETPTAAAALNELAVAFYRDKRYAESEGYVRRALEANGRINGVLWLNLGDALRRQGKWLPAGVALERAVASGGGTADGINQLGLAYYALGHHDRAAGQFALAADAEPDSVTYRVNRADALLRDQQPWLAEAVLLEAVAADPESARAHNFLGNTYHDQKRYDEAAAKYRRAIELDDDNPTYHANLAGSLLLLNRRDEALTAGRRAVELGYTADRHWALKQLGL